ncbi:hypothetical protein AB4072_02100 [Microvirga sp. 2MCAF38]|uniref:hypothetical protein n=1 Tax=Microvirga sp. 2MCAF38 TaxID=3232989 RepID=UPI003F98D846
MVIALFALALAMIVGGLFTFVLGWDDVLLERGWTTAIAGSIAASSGVLLIGLAMIVMRLTEIRSDLAHFLSGTRVPSAEPKTPSQAEKVSPVAPGLAAGAAAGAAAGYAVSREEGEAETSLPLFEAAEEDKREEPRISLDDFDDLLAPEAEPKASEPGAESEMRIPDFLVERRETLAVFAETPQIQEDLPAEEVETEFASPEEAEGDFVSKYASEPAMEFPAEPAPETVPEEEEPEPVSSATVIGTYNSGDNTYVMFSDGSIEAKTPQGNYRFGSLDELKAFIAAGGESSSSI